MGTRSYAVMLIVLMAGAVATPSTSRGAITSASGNVHVAATVFFNPNSTADNPPDTSFVPPATSATNSANATLSPFESHITATVNALNNIQITGSGFAVRGGPGTLSTALASGTVTFTETGTELVGLTQTVFGAGLAGSSLSLKDGSSTTVLSNVGPMLSPGTYSLGPAMLSPGTYSLQWAFNLPDSTGVSPSSVAIQLAPVPEPAGASVLLCAAAPLWLNRRHRRR